MWVIKHDLRNKFVPSYVYLAGFSVTAAHICVELQIRLVTAYDRSRVDMVTDR
jgi:hypothetical protein